MQDLPHQYVVSAEGSSSGNIILSSDGLADLPSAPPVQFGGPGDLWSPEDLFVGAVADCFVLAFRAIARVSRFDWISLGCSVDGTLDRIDREIQFTGFRISATLVVPAGSNVEKAQRLLQKSKRACLITNSLKADTEVVGTVQIGDA